MLFSRGLSRAAPKPGMDLIGALLQLISRSELICSLSHSSTSATLVWIADRIAIVLACSAAWALADDRSAPLSRFLDDDETQGTLPQRHGGLLLR